MVLIETLWNVKSDADIIIVGTGTSINRNIVECKDRHVYPLHRWSCGINRNIVECKVVYKMQQRSAMCRINRNIVECKAASPLLNATF